MPDDAADGGERGALVLRVHVGQVVGGVHSVVAVHVEAPDDLLGVAEGDLNVEAFVVGAALLVPVPARRVVLGEGLEDGRGQDGLVDVGEELGVGEVGEVVLAPVEDLPGGVCGSESPVKASQGDLPGAVAAAALDGP